MIVIDSKYKFFGHAANGTISANSTGNVDFLMTEDLSLYGAELIQTGGNMGDYVSFKIIDKDNVLGYGANTVLKEWVTKWYIDPSTTRWNVDSDYAATIPAGIYIRLTYTNTNLLNQVKVAMNFRFIDQS